MNVDSMGNMGIATDPQKVRPGMIYVDLSSRRNRRQIYEAYVNGASLIFTHYNFTDPELPVIKVKNLEDTLYSLYNRFSGEKGRTAKFIAVLGDSDNSMLMELIKSMLNSEGTGRRINAIPVNVDTTSGNMSYLENFGFESGVFTDGSCFTGNCGNQYGADFLNRLFGNKAIIINNDEPEVIRIIEQCTGLTPITYGLNKKAFATASSMDVGDMTCFNYCVQKRFHTRSGKVVDPFEIPMSMNALGSHNICSALAAITFGLYYDVEISQIKALIEGYKAPARHFQRLYDGDYTIIDNYCRSMHDYYAAFEAIQILNYNNLVLVISLSQKSGQDFHMEKASLITEWVKLLKCKEVILTSCMDDDTRIGELPLKSIRIYKKLFKENNIRFKYYHLLQHAMESSLSGMMKKDLLVFLGGEEMNEVQRLLQRYLKKTKNRMH